MMCSFQFYSLIFLEIHVIQDERWRPILGVEQILISVISMLPDPKDESPANLDAVVMWRNDSTALKK